MDSSTEMSGAMGQGVPVPGHDPVHVRIVAGDPFLYSGLQARLADADDIRIVEDTTADDVVFIVVTESVDDEATNTLRALRKDGGTRFLLIVSQLDDAGLLAATEAGVAGLLRRSEATDAALTTSVHAVASGDGALPPDLVGRLLGQVGHLQRRVLAPRGLSFSGLTEREVAVLKLLAEGLSTAEIGRSLFYSERTVKNIVHDLTTRFELRNRTHAVAYAIREGLI